MPQHNAIITYMKMACGHTMHIEIGQMHLNFFFLLPFIPHINHYFLFFLFVSNRKSATINFLTVEQLEKQKYR